MSMGSPLRLSGKTFDRHSFALGFVGTVETPMKSPLVGQLIIHWIFFQKLKDDPTACLKMWEFTGISHDAPDFPVQFLSIVVILA